ncbi:amidohydrolase family protein [Actinoallomurus rhizosphaericola]|uniref:amidohydrolase family protein n=1 Tax=Actinoallomurus rhizosphaericola TaxID=2952536 RepID=UPI00209112F7|nr:amidohydrolase family protein [Actinoallomurus rhizosphaericola]MCO5994633.1 amidohydrolase [Actinoallomurus rhizosphaericola]
MPSPSDQRTVRPPGDDAEIPAFWRSLGLPGLIDVHTHFMPDNVLTKVWAYFDRFAETDGRPRWEIRYRHEEERRLRLLREFGVRRFTAMLYPHRPGMAEWLNGWAAGFAARTPDCLHTATFFPEPEAGTYVAAAIGDGARVFKAHVQVGAYDPRDPLLDPVWGLLAESRTPVVVHCGSGPEPGPHTGPAAFAEVLARHPRLIAIVAHMGMPEYAEFLGLADRHPGLHLDTTMVFTDFTEGLHPWPAGLTPRLADLRDRVLLGTDFPNIPHSYAHQLTALTRLGLGDDWLRAVCHDNAVRLFAL